MERTLAVLGSKNEVNMDNYIRLKYCYNHIPACTPILQPDPDRILRRFQWQRCMKVQRGGKSNQLRRKQVQPSSALASAIMPPPGEGLPGLDIISGSRWFTSAGS